MFFKKYLFFRTIIFKEEKCIQTDWLSQNLFYEKSILVFGLFKRREAAIDDRRGAIVRLELGLWSSAKSLLPLSLRSGLSLSFVHVGFFFLWLSLSFARATENV